MSPGQRTVLERLESYVEGNDEGDLTRETAVAHLVENDVERAEAHDRIEGLLLKGYLYEVNGELRIPPRL